MGGRWKKKWGLFLKGLVHGGIRLSDKMENILWMHNTENRDVTINMAYELITTSYLEKISEWHHK